MKTRTLFTVLALGILATSVRAAVVLTPDLDGNYSVSTTNANFTNWATGNGATTTGSFGTYGTGFGVQSGSTTSSSTATLIIPFAADAGFNFDTAVLDLSAAIWNIGAETYTAPAVSVFVRVGLTETRVFEWVSAEQLPSGSAVQYNYAGTAPGESYYGRFSTTVDLSSLVSGVSAFELLFTANQAWPSELGYGGAFYQDSSAPFELSGQLAAIPEPQALALALAGCAFLLGRRRKLR